MSVELKDLMSSVYGAEISLKLYRSKAEPCDVKYKTMYTIWEDGEEVDNKEIDAEEVIEDIEKLDDDFIKQLSDLLSGTNSEETVEEIEPNGDIELETKEEDEEETPEDEKNEEEGIEESVKYGTKRDYPKIEIFVDKKYKCTTTWAKNCKEAVEKYLEENPKDKEKTVKAYFKK